MKRPAFFLLWTLIFFLFALMLGGQVARMTEAFSRLDTHEARDVKDGFQVGVQAGLASRRASFAFMGRYWHVVLAGAVLVSGAGSISGVLPGTQKTKSTEPPPLPPS